MYKLPAHSFDANNALIESSVFTAFQIYKGDHTSHNGITKCVTDLVDNLIKHAQVKYFY